ncbi:hypothetical protein K458DRAFT_398662 [Lentithecium fluviatile CBS 122367]|uniref:Uncharacterized protein n=1 Tax=Lentithecium fluviatile CBS 122367 TaxID=1168545 RepID=A0A6G1JJC3_9PLEO|nr:hypothetical protein K458DRAFT_398662 [Lentithecium fluviatile CBS 122367]
MVALTSILSVAIIALPLAAALAITGSAIALSNSTEVEERSTSDHTNPTTHTSPFPSSISSFSTPNHHTTHSYPLTHLASLHKSPKAQRAPQLLQSLRGLECDTGYFVWDVCKNVCEGNPDKGPKPFRSQPISCPVPSNLPSSTPRTPHKQHH